jgi:hypothetical protein
MAAGITEFPKVAGDPARVAGKIGVMGKIPCAIDPANIPIARKFPVNPARPARRPRGG